MTQPYKPQRGWITPDQARTAEHLPHLDAAAKQGYEIHGTQHHRKYRQGYITGYATTIMYVITEIAKHYIR